MTKQQMAFMEKAEIDPRLHKLKGVMDDITELVSLGLLPADETISTLEKVARGYLFSNNDWLKHVACHDLKEMDCFAVADHFKVGQIVGDIPFVRISPLFSQLFGDVIEDRVPARRVSLWNLVKALEDEDIFKEDGEDGRQRDKSYMSLGHLFQLIALGPKSGCRLDTHANICYARVPKSKIPRPEPQNKDGLSENAVRELERKEAAQQAAYDRLPNMVICTLQWHVYTEGGRKGIHISASLPSDKKVWSVHDQVAL
jgi:hypothetical protein